jgi:hypothetical protein
VPDLDTLLALLVEGGKHHRYSVAWVDFLARGRSLGRSVLTQGDFATLDDLPSRGRKARAPAGLRPPAAAARAGHGAQRAAQPGEHHGVQRVLVPAPPPPAAGRAPVDRDVLLPARRRRRLEPDVRAPGLPPVADHGALRGRGRAARVDRGAVRPPGAQLPGGAQVLRRSRWAAGPTWPRTAACGPSCCR